jgi:hypothetical protein
VLLRVINCTVAREPDDRTSTTVVASAGTALLGEHVGAVDVDDGAVAERDVVPQIPSEPAVCGPTTPSTYRPDRR